MVIGHNIPAMLTHTNMMRANQMLRASLQRLGSGYRINSAKEDAAGLAIANKLTFQVTGLDRASENSSHGVALVQTAEGALAEVHNMLQRMRELAVQSANGVYENSDREKIQVEIDDLLEEIDKVADRTEFNKIKVLSGEASRVMVSMDGSGKVDKTVSKMLYISDKTAPGLYDYEIVKPGSPAVMIGTVDPDPDAQAGDAAGTVVINGEEIDVLADDTVDSVRARINEVCFYAGLEYRVEGNAAALVTKVAGSDQYLQVTGDSATIAFLGLTKTADRDEPVKTLEDLYAGAIRGTDAVINLTPEPDPGEPESAFAGMAYTAQGNAVEIVGANGEQVRFNIQMVFQGFDADQVTYSYGHPATPGNPATPSVEIQVTPAATPGGAQEVTQTGTALNADRNLAMRLDLKDYGAIMLQIGQSYNNGMEVSIPKLDAETLGLVEIKGGVIHKKINYQTWQSSGLAIEMCDDAIAVISMVRSRLGAFQNRLESTIRSLDTASENTSKSRSLIRDADMAKESTLYAQYNVMYQAGIAMLTQANERPSQLLQLLQ